MTFTLKDANVFRDGAFHKETVTVTDGILHFGFQDNGGTAIPADSLSVFPGFSDVHVHLREPGFSYKETIFSGTAAAARGGFTTVCPMPNLKPVPDNKEHLEEELKLIRRGALVCVRPYGAITAGEKGEELAALEEMAPDVVAFSDDGHGVQSEAMMRAAMEKAKALGKIIVAHCEDNSLLNGGCIHDGAYAKAHGHRGISSESEWRQVERDLKLAAETGCEYHVCHVSTKESVALIREAKKSGVHVTAETAPHYLLLTEDDLEEDGRFKMNPPLREKADREALIEGILDGTIDIIATDHAPHGLEEKRLGLEKSPMGVTGLEIAFPLLYTYLVKPGIVPMKRLMELLCEAPGARFGIKKPFEEGARADFTVFDLSEEYPVNPYYFLSKGTATPFEGRIVSGACRLTVADGRIAYIEEALKEYVK